MRDTLKRVKMWTQWKKGNRTAIPGLMGVKIGRIIISKGIMTYWFGYRLIEVLLCPADKLLTLSDDKGSNLDKKRKRQVR